MAALEIGAKAPDFELPASGGDKMGLADLIDEDDYLILAFFPKARTSVCGAQLAMLDEFRDDLAGMGAALAAISVDSIEDLEAWAQDEEFGFPLLSDASPKGAVAASYGVMSTVGVAERALFIVDTDCTIVYSYVSPMKENPGVDRLFKALENMEEE